MYRRTYAARQTAGPCGVATANDAWQAVNVRHVKPSPAGRAGKQQSTLNEVLKRLTDWVQITGPQLTTITHTCTNNEHGIIGSRGC